MSGKNHNWAACRGREMIARSAPMSDRSPFFARATVSPARFREDPLPDRPMRARKRVTLPRVKWLERRDPFDNEKPAATGE